MRKIVGNFNFEKLITLETTKNLLDLPWNAHPNFEGVELKHLITAKESQGIFSYHLVRILPYKKIGYHNHQEQIETHEVMDGSGICILDGQEYPYQPSCMTIFPQKVNHEIIAKAEGLMLLAKFFPALC